MYQEKETTKNKFSTDDALYRVLKKQLTTHKKTGNKWEIFGLIKRFPKLFCLNFQDPEEQANFNDWIEEKLDTILNSYNPRISSFYIFLNNTLNFYLRNYKKFANRKKAAMYAFMYDSGKSIIIENTEPRLFYENTAADPTAPYLTSFVPDKLKLWLIILGLKCADYLDGDLKYKLCSITGFEEAHLDNLIGTLKESYKTRQAKIEGLKEILYKYYIKTYNIQYQIKNTTFDETEELEKLKTRLSEYKIRQQKILQRLNQIKKTPSNKKIAEILNIEKGTVDYAMRVMLEDSGTGFYNKFCDKIRHEDLLSQQQYP